PGRNKHYSLPSGRLFLRSGGMRTPVWGTLEHPLR
ncbi:hypothetical protein M2105_006529, partial [Paenibacillus sp. PastF-1]|nr:hypothetical protein [Paenibacillus sp. PastF-1]MDH6483856.1 hypothetical protein [Paenibacillus sp. PastH-2]